MLPSSPSGCITACDELTKVFIAKFFPSSKIAILRNQITTFTQREDESLRKVWEHFKDLLRLCPHRGFQHWMLVQAFYSGVSQPMRPTINAALGGTLTGMTKDEAYNLIEEVL